MSELKVPMFIGHGGDDKVCLSIGSQMLYDAISSSDKAIKVNYLVYVKVSIRCIWMSNDVVLCKTIQIQGLDDGSIKR